MTVGDGALEPVGADAIEQLQETGSNCARDARCDPRSNTCVILDKAVGNSCAAGDEECGAFAYCDSTTARCRARISFGNACTTSPVSDPCIYSFCDPITNTCKAECD